MKKLVATLLLTILIGCNSSGNDRTVVEELAVIIEIDIDEDGWGGPVVETTLVTEKGFIDIARGRVGTIGDTLKVQVVYADSLFMGMRGGYSSITNLSRKFNDR